MKTGKRGKGLPGTWQTFDARHGVGSRLALRNAGGDMGIKEHIGPSANLEDIEAHQRQRAPEEDEGVTYDD